MEGRARRRGVRYGEVGTLEVGGGALGDGAQFLDGGFIAAPLKTFEALTQGFGDGAGHSFHGLPGDRLGETVRFRVLHVEALGVSFLPNHCLPFFTITPVTPVVLRNGTKSYNRSSLQQRFLNPSTLDAALPGGGN